jgi:hypothetical protein
VDLAVTRRRGLTRVILVREGVEEVMEGCRPAGVAEGGGRRWER